MRILHVSSLWEPVVLGGAEKYAGRLAEEQQRAGHTVGAITFGVTGDLVVEAVPAWPYRLDQFQQQPRWKRAAFRLADVYNPFAASRMRKAIKRFRPDVVHSHSIPGLSTAALTAGTDVAHVHHVHDQWLMCRRTTSTLPSGEPCEDRSCKVIAAVRSQIVQRHPPELVLAPSRYVMDAHSRLQWTDGRMRHVPYSIGTEFEGHRAKVPTAGQPISFGYIGQLSVQKGLETLLRAFAGLEGEHRLIVAGEGDLAPAIARAGPRVTALGWVNGSAREQFFADVDCLVVPSIWPDTAPLVVTEGRANGLPVIGARIGGIPEKVSERCEPLMFTPGKVGELRDSLEAFASEPGRFTPDASSRVRIGPSWPDHERQIGEFYQEAVESGRRAG